MPRKTLSIKKLTILAIDFMQTISNEPVESQEIKMVAIQSFIEFVNLNKNENLELKIKLPNNKTK